MKYFTSMKALALVAGMLLAGTQASEAKVTKPTSAGGIVISKVFFNSMKNDANKAFILANYIELYNNSADTLDIAGMFLGLAESHSDAEQAWTVDAMQAEHKDSVALKQIFQIPTDQVYKVNPGQSIVICNAAFDHTAVASKAPNLSAADFESKTQNNAYKDYHNDNVPGLVVAHTYNPDKEGQAAYADFINFVTTGPGAMVLLAHNTDLTKCSTGFQRGKTSGSVMMFVPKYKVLDGVDVVVNTKAKSPAADQKRLPESIDAGFTSQATPGGNNGEAIVRKTAFITSDGRTVLFDTDISTVDFEVTTDLSIHTYSQEISGLSDGTITIPESGFAAVNIEKPFCSMDNVYFVHVNASNNASTTDLGYYEFPGDSLLLIKGAWIAVGKPGTHAIKLSESQGVMKSRSSMVNWAEEDTKTVKQTDRMIYKFTAEGGKVGFQRVPATDGKYNQATFTDADRLHIIVTEAIADKIAAANGATGHADLDFIAWHGIMPEQVATGIDGVQVKDDAQQGIFNLQGQKMIRLQKGLNIVNGKKIVVK